jgi:SAM-dependent methyltransferase
MNAAPVQPLPKTRSTCAICGTPALETVLDLPQLPLTGLYTRDALSPGPAPADQRLLLCVACGHGQLAHVQPPEYVYDGTYSFRTSTSATARAGTQFFLRSLDAFAPQRTFACAVDIGCNDLHLLRELAGTARHRAGIDPVWRTLALDPADAGIQVIGATVESIDVAAALPAAPDLIVLRHTLEHIEEPAAVIGALAAIAAPGALFVIEVPGFDNLIERRRFDHVFHQHLH